MKVLITGASRGIGQSLCKVYLQNHFEVYGVARQFKEDWPGTNSLSCDLSSEDQLEEFYSFIKTNGPFDVCVQNLGINKSGSFVKAEKDDLEQMSFTNLTLPILTTQYLIKNKLIKGGGSMIYLNSLSHFVSYPGSSVYAATKDGLHSFVRSMRSKFHRKYHFLSIYPGPVETEQARKNSPLHVNSKRMCSDLLAKKIYKAQVKKKNSLIPGITMSAFAVFSKWAPAFTESMMYKTIYKPLEKRREV